MKNFISLYFILLIIISVSCDVVDQKPEGTLTKDNFYQTKKNAIAATNAMYSSMHFMQGWGWRDYALGPSDDIRIPFYNPSINGLLDSYQFDPSNPRFNTWWSNWYNILNKANLVLNRVPDINMDTSLKDRLLGEGHFIRAYSYFNLTKEFGEIPLILNSEEVKIEVASSSVDEVFNQIISDLENAENLLPSNYGASDVGRPTNTAATALLARVYLWRSNWEMVVQKTKQIVDSGNAGLMADYANCFSLDHENNKEIIYSYQFSPERGQTWARDIGAARGSNMIPGGGDAETVPEIQAYNAYESDDYRRKVNFLTEYVNEEGDTVRYQDFPARVPNTGKFYDRTRTVAENNGLNRVIIRYADVLLMYAEALNELGRTDEAYKYLNMVRKRARNGDPSASPQDIPRGSLSQSEFREVIYKERRLELMFEGIRRDDLVRTGRLLEAIKKPGIKGGEFIESHEVLYPKPSVELNANPLLEQNPGYGN